jgi:hypothetical protein
VAQVRDEFTSPSRIAARNLARLVLTVEALEMIIG